MNDMNKQNMELKSSLLSTTATLDKERTTIVTLKQDVEELKEHVQVPSLSESSIQYAMLYHGKF